MGIGIWQIALVVLLILIVFGAGKLPKVMADLGKGLKSFKEGAGEDTDPIQPTDTGTVVSLPKAAPKKAAAKPKKVIVEKAPKEKAVKPATKKTAVKKPAAKKAAPKAKASPKPKK